MGRRDSTVNNNCSNCIYFAALTGTLGQCHRFPPAADQTGGYGKFPRVSAVDWCGEWRGKEMVEPLFVMIEEEVITDG